MSAPVRIDWRVEGLVLAAIEPTPAEVAAVAEQLAWAYNDPRNAPLLGHDQALDAGDVIDHYAESAAAGARQFLLYVDGALAGDADLRGIRGAAVDPAGVVRGGTAEFAFLIAAPSAQGRGLGTRCALMLHRFGFDQLGLDAIYASVAPANAASRRVFAKLGYRDDGSAVARSYADAPDDHVLSIERAVFAAGHGPAVAAIAIGRR